MTNVSCYLQYTACKVIANIFSILHRSSRRSDRERKCKAKSSGQREPKTFSEQGSVEDDSRERNETAWRERGREANGTAGHLRTHSKKIPFSHCHLSWADDDCRVRQGEQEQALQQGRMTPSYCHKEPLNTRHNVNDTHCTCNTVRHC